MSPPESLPPIDPPPDPDPPTPYRYLLDEYPDNCAYAYAFRKLRSAYTGACCRVRRSLDNTEQDFGWSGNGLDEAAVIAWVGSGVEDYGFLVTLYQQSTLYPTDHGFQTVAASQPILVYQGEIQKSNGFTFVSNQALGQTRALLAPSRPWITATGISTPGVNGVSPNHYMTFFRWLMDTVPGNNRSILRRGASTVRIGSVRYVTPDNILQACTADGGTIGSINNAETPIVLEDWNTLRLMTTYKHQTTGRGYIRRDGVQIAVAESETHLTAPNPGSHAFCLGSETSAGINGITGWNIFVHYRVANHEAIPDMEAILMQEVD